MEKQEVTRDYRMGDPILIGKCIEVHAFMQRDAAPFNDFNVMAPDIAAFNDNINSFQDIETDEELQGVVSEYTELKDAKADEVKVAVRAILTRAQNKFGLGTARYKKFGTKGMDAFDDLQLLACSKRVKRVAEGFLALLGAVGLTAAMVTALDVLNEAFEKTIEDQRDAIADRDIATEDRIEQANELYKLLVDYCNIGKNIWVTTDEAKYNDYVIYDTPTGAAPPVVTP